jgi:hypothetical protein
VCCTYWATHIISLQKHTKIKICGTDQIPVELIQVGGEAVDSDIRWLINSIWNEEELPEQWKESIIVPLYKKGDITDCSNYRGISLLSTTYKILSSFLLSSLTPYADKIIGDHQRRFGRNRSSTDHIFCTGQILEKDWEYNVAVHTSRKPMIRLGGRSCIIFSLSFVSLWNQ